MGQPNYARCKRCGRHRDEVGMLSWTRLCGSCGPAIARENMDALHLKRGPRLKAWRRKHAGAVGGVLVEDLPEAVRPIAAAVLLEGGPILDAPDLTV